MNGDLVARLRVWADTINVRKKEREIMAEAAGEIERLRLMVVEKMTELSPENSRVHGIRVLDEI